ncbi:tetratricopeptide repeat protein [Terasakiella sp. A23]|uniref:tetratricopeptide repeat protein n=1 Tax=Terasakiella sp. FCG-A23 TaxID=3080561 RepID=UPI002955666F|nr:tetratricopeptide repeat protein [Terasakiella sp. A23]MDV7341472.1 tetratricopeptide repeat protein [Terasakiella sp. A23]
MSAFSGLDKQAQENELSDQGIDSKEKESNHTPAPISVSLSLAAAIRAHKKGKMEKAVQIYSGILRKYPDHADANYLLGVAAFERGLKEDAIAMIERAIKSEPDNASYYGKLGEILTLMGFVERADEAYEKAAELAPGDVRFHLGRAQIMERNGEIEKALQQYRNIIERWDDSYEAFYRCAAIEARIGERDDARTHAKQAIAIKEDYAEAHFLYALLISATGEQKEARAHFVLASRHSASRNDLHLKIANKLIQLHDYDGAMSALHRETKLNPKNSKAFCLMGDCLSAKEEYEGAVLSYDRAIENKPTLAIAYARRGLALLALGHVQDAHDSCQKAVQIAPNDWESLTALGILLREDDKINEAIDVLARAINVAPNQPKPLLEIALAYQDNLDLIQALHYIREAQSLNVKDSEIEFRLGQMLLQSGDWAHGWKAYEARKKLKTYQPLLSGKDISVPQWDGKPLGNKRIILFAEGGFSEAIQFVRFVGDVKDRVNDVYICCQKDLARLFAAVDGISGVIPHGTPLPRHDVVASLNSLPLLLGLKDETDLPIFQPYLSASPKDVKVWQERIQQDASGTAVGLVWQGSKDYRKDSRRSPGIWPFSRLFYMRDLDFFGLQVGDGSDVLTDPQLSKVVKNYGIDLLDFADTAAVIEALDLVITCDSAVAHLAGAMGKPVWMVLPHAVDWRWGIPASGEGVACSWYPSMTIYRQAVAGDWADVFARLGQELDRFTPSK